MSFAVVVRCAVMTCNGNCNVDRSDRHVTVGYLKGDCRKVVVCILELICGESHIRRSGVSSFRLCRTAEREVFIYIVEVGV